MVAGLRNVDGDLARRVAESLGLERLPRALPAAVSPIEELVPSPALSILANPPRSFAGRKLGILLTDGADAKLLSRLRAAVQKAQANVELIAPRIGGVTTSDGERVPADQKIDGAPSVLYDAVVVLASEPGGTGLAALPAAQDFVTDAFVHCKFVGYTPGAVQRMLRRDRASPTSLMTGSPSSGRDGAASGFLERCRGNCATGSANHLWADRLSRTHGGHTCRSVRLGLGRGGRESRPQPGRGRWSAMW